MSRNEKEPGNAIRKWKVNVNESTTSDDNTKTSAQDSHSMFPNQNPNPEDLHLATMMNSLAFPESSLTPTDES